MSSPVLSSSQAFSPRTPITRNDATPRTPDVASPTTSNAVTSTHAAVQSTPPALRGQVGNPPVMLNARDLETEIRSCRRIEDFVALPYPAGFEV